MPISPLVLIHGDEPYLVDRSARAWRSEATAAGAADGTASGIGVEIFDQPSKLAPLAFALAEMPLFDPERIIIVRDPPQLSGQARRGADAAEGLADALRNRATTTLVCIVNHGAVAASNPVLQAVRELGGQVLDHPRLKGRDLRGFVTSAVAERGLKLDAASIEHVLTTAGPDLGMISNELEKLVAYSGGGRVSQKDVVALVSGDPQVETWNVIERLLSPSPGRGAAAIDALLDEGRPPQLLLITLAGQVRELVLARALLSERRLGAPAIAAEMGMPSWRADKLVSQAKQLPGRVAVGWLRELQRIDAATKAGDADDMESLRIFARRAAADVVALRLTN